MKSIFYSRFFILLPWVLIVIIVMDIDTKRSSVRSTAGSYLARLGDAQRRERPAHAAPAGANRTALLPLIYAVTPTYSRAVQKAELTRLANTFRQVPRFHWVVVEDASARTELVAHFLARCGVPYTHLHALTPRRFKRSGMPRATEQRNAALGWLRTHRATREPGVVFFADDDNTYSLELFEEVTRDCAKGEGSWERRERVQMRSTKGVSVWPVGLVGGRRYERPIVENGKVVGWYTGWRADRPFAIDMAGFAVNLQVILANPRALFKRRGAKPGMQESDFLKQITKVEDLEPKAKNCTQVLVWHTRTEKVNLGNEPKRHQDSLMIEV
ncbi:galactosylgalactosylxylosylprotein 3-beta-glucuronosyltransferase 2 isoform X1 [Pygocentrus nattereri]|uniref:galactosylgalactosylxylosylprotein 3-beta-glucuronosyltransferase 2 isoform X1 n=1 Tax=Pygocentrus nattereri TaxID=42514 RepID=UPI0008143C99|nr:galactosylgalactosylxylosylprotein 3-beta-glucuronosyltransferase 2 isoform X1 [Pygocentrus nattereri]